MLDLSLRAAGFFYLFKKLSIGKIYLFSSTKIEEMNNDGNCQSKETVQKLRIQKIHRVQK